MSTWETNKKFSDFFLPEIKRILGEHLISEPPVEEDMERNTDLIILKMEAVRIGCRVRRYHYLERYSDEFTIRCSLPSGMKTELAKIIEGWGDYFFYGFSDERKQGLAGWTLCDLKVFRLWFNQQIVRGGGKIPGIKRENSDNSSAFYVFRYDQLPPSFIVAAGQRSNDVYAHAN